MSIQSFSKKSRSRKAGNRMKRNNINNNKLVIYRDLGRFAPDKLVTKLVYSDTTLTRTVTSSDAMNWGYRSSAYDPDPAALTGSIPGFVELANLYTSYCVRSMKLDLELANQNTESVIVVVWPSNVLQNTNSLTKADLMEYSSNVRGKSCVVSNSQGMNKGRIHTLASGSTLVGHRFETDLDYTASTSSSPAEMFYINIGVLNPFGNFSYPMLTRSRVIYEVEFFRLRQLES